MLEGISRMDRFYDELEQFLNGPEKEETWNLVFRKDAKRISKYLQKTHTDLKVEIKDISTSKVRVTIKKTTSYYVVAGKYDIIAEGSEFKIVSRDKRERRYATVSFESLRDDPSLTSIEKVIERIEAETTKFFGDEKATCYPHNNPTRNMIREIAFYNQKEFHSCDCE